MVHAGNSIETDDELPKLDPFLPAGPLLAKIDRLALEWELSGLGEAEEDELNNFGGQLRNQGGWFHALAGVPITGHKWEKRIERARKEGRIRATFVDEFCVELLRIHPCSMYGDTWFGLDVAEEQEIAA